MALLPTTNRMESEVMGWRPISCVSYQANNQKGNIKEKRKEKVQLVTIFSNPNLSLLLEYIVYAITGSATLLEFLPKVN